MLQPVGPRPPHVYWVRRLLLLLLAVGGILAVAHACAPSSGGGTSARLRADQRPAPTTPGGSSPSSSVTPDAGVVACRPPALHVEVASDAPSYTLGVDPRFTAVVRNIGPTCLFPTALSSRTWRILSGTDTVWSTADCPRSTDGKRVRLRAGQQITYVLPWDRFRSTPGCAVAGAPAQAGTYRLYVTIAGASGKPVVFHLAT